MTTQTKVQKESNSQKPPVTKGTVVELQALRSAMVDRETLRASVKRLEIEKELLKDMLKEALTT